MKEICSVFRNLHKAGTIVLSLILLLAGSGVAMAQLSAVSGVVYDPDGQALEGATVVVEGTVRGTITDRDGRFRVQARTGEVLSFSYLGLLEQKVTWNGQAVLDVTLEADVASVEDIIVVGFGQARRGSITGAIGQVRADELLSGPLTNITSMLSSYVAGMSSMQSTGQPGSDFGSIKIRGAGAGALFIVDGVPRDNVNYLDPNEVETVSVLKDASATAVYGLGGQGGVIIVTTKKGEKGRPKIDYRASFGVSMNTAYPEFLDGPGYAYWYNKALELDGAEPIFTSDHVARMINGDDSDGWSNTNWFKKIFGTGFNQTHNINLNGGTENTQYFASIGYLNQKGNIDNFNFDRYNARMNLDTKISKSLHFTMGLSGQVGDQRSPGFGAGGTASGSSWLPVAEQAAYSHSYLPATYVAPEGASELMKSYNGLPVATNTGHNNPVNPVAATELSGKNRSVNYYMQSNASLTWNIPGVEGLSAKFLGSYDAYMTTSRSISTPYYMMLAAAPGLTTTDITYNRQLDPRGQSDITVSEGFYRTQRLTSQSALEYKNLFGKHRVSGLVLLETRDRWASSLYASAKGMLFPEIAQIDDNDGKNNKVSGVHGARQKQAGLVWRAIWEYDDRFIVEASGRYDGSYKFIGNIAGRRWGYFPAASVAWRMSNESFIRDNAPWIDNLKLRASLGETGNDGVTEFSYLSRMEARTGAQVIFGDTPSGTYYSSVVANPLLTWDRERQFNMGVDGTLWKGLLGFELDYFYKYRYDILGGAGSGNSPSMGGYYKTYVNNNRTDTHGFEMKLTHDNRVGKFTYGATFILSYAYTKWLKNNNDTPETSPWRRAAGHQTGMYYGFKADGLFQSEEEIDASPIISGRRPRVGDIKYVDMDGDGQITHGVDNGYFGRPAIAPWAGSFSLRAGWMNFDVNVMFGFAWGNDVRMTGLYYNGYEDSTLFTKPFKAKANAPVYLVEGSWRPDNTNAEFPRLSVNSPGSNNDYASTFWFRDGKYLRMKNFQLGYTIPKSALAKIGIESVRVFVEGSNLFTLSALPGSMDPEWPSVSAGYYPQQRTFMGGVSVTF